MFFRVNDFKMPLIPKVAMIIRPVRILAFGLFFAVFFLSFHFVLDTEIGAGRGTYSSIAKVRKDFRNNHGGDPEVALMTVLVNWIPTFYSSCFRVADKQKVPPWYLLKSIRIRAPPFTHSL